MQVRAWIVDQKREVVASTGIELGRLQLPNKQPNVIQLVGQSERSRELEQVHRLVPRS